MPINIKKKKISLSLQGLIDPLLKNYNDKIIFISKIFPDIVDGIEIGFFLDQTIDVTKIFSSDKILNALNQYSYNTIHVANRSSSISLTDIGIVMQHANNLFKNQQIKHIGFHLDFFQKFDFILSLNKTNIPLFWENLGNTVNFGNRFQDMLKAIKLYPEWYVTFDIAHAMEMILKGEPYLKTYIKRLNLFIEQLHFSWPDNLYSDIIADKEFKTAHSFVHLKKNICPKYFDIVKKINPKIVTIEGVIPQGDIGIELVLREINFIKSIFDY